MIKKEKELEMNLQNKLMILLKGNKKDIDK